MFGVGMPELIIILVIMLFIFGSAKLPQLGASLGEAIRGFRKAADAEPVRDEPQRRAEGALGTGTIPTAGVGGKVVERSVDLGKAGPTG